jgi:hypothetical protein
MPSQTYKNLDFSREELSAAMRQSYDQIIDFVTTPAFKVMFLELMSLPQQDRPAFVARVVLQPEEMTKRGVHVPDGILIQSSAFGDRRPTLFAVKKFLPSRFHKVWENVNITFDNEYEDDAVSRDPEACWRVPLPVAVQNAALTAGIDLESLPSEDFNFKVVSKPIQSN